MYKFIHSLVVIYSCILNRSGITVNPAKGKLVFCAFYVILRDDYAQVILPVCS